MSSEGRSLRQVAERGAAATLVAVLAATGVLLGLLAISVDVGNMMFERRQLQNAADATSMALAQICAGSAAACKAGPTFSELNTLANANTRSSDSLLTEEVCGARLPENADLPKCATVPEEAISNLSMCPALPEWLADSAHIPYVETYTQTEDLESFFIGRDTTITNCARAAWGPAASAPVLPLAFSDCEWYEATNNGKTYGIEVALGLNYKDKNYCDSSVGRDYEGGFGWLDHPAKTCLVDLKERWLPGTTGMGKGNDCEPHIKVGDVVHLPIFDCISKTKDEACPKGAKQNNPVFYRLAGYGAFEITGFDIPMGTDVGGVDEAVKKQCKPEKTNNGHCMFGRFLKGLVPAGEISTDPTTGDFGLTIIQVAG